MPVPQRLSSENTRCVQGISTWAAILSTTFGRWSYLRASDLYAGKPSVSSPDLGATVRRTKAPIFSVE